MRALHVFLFLTLMAVCASAPFLELFKFRSSDRRDVDASCPPSMGGKHCRCFRRGRSFQMRCRGGFEDDDEGPMLKSATEDTKRVSNQTSPTASSSAESFGDGFFNPIRGIMQSILPGFLSPFGPPPQARHPPPHYFHFPAALGVIISHHDDVRPGESKSSNTTTTTTQSSPKSKTDEGLKKS